MPSGDPFGAPSNEFPGEDADAERVDSAPEEDEDSVQGSALDDDASTVEDSEESVAAHDEEHLDEVTAEESESEDEVVAEEAEESDLAESDSAEEADDDEDEDVEEEDDEDEVVGDGTGIPSPEEVDTKAWYVLKVQSNREDSIREAIIRRVKMESLEEYLGEIVVPTEKISEIKGGKKRVTERKFFPGYIMVHVELNHDIWFAIRETPGVGDFVGANNEPVPMTREDVDRMLGREAATEVAQPRLKINFEKGDRVKIKEGTFENFEGDVEEVIEGKGLVRVMIQIFGRPTPVELEYWQVEPV